MADFREDRFTFCGEGMSGIAVAGAQTRFDFKITGVNRCLAGVQLLIDRQAFGDYLACQVVDVDNILGAGAGAIVKTYTPKWMVAPHADNISVWPGYISDVIPQNLYIRVIYNSVGATGVNVALNFYLHQKT